MWSTVVKMLDICTAGFSVLSLSSSASTAFATVTSEAPLALNTPNVVAGTPVEPGDAAHLGNAVVHFGDFPQAHEFAAGKDDLGIAERLRGFCTAEHANRLLAAAQPGHGRRRHPC